MLKLNAVAVDSSDSTDTVYNFCFPRAGRRIMAIKGAAGSRPSITVSKSKMKGGARLWIVGVDTLKQMIFNKLANGKGVRFSESLEPVFLRAINERTPHCEIPQRPLFNTPPFGPTGTSGTLSSPCGSAGSPPSPAPKNSPEDNAS